MVSYVNAVVAVTVVRVLLFVFHVCMLRQCEGARVSAMLVWGMDEMWLYECTACGWYTWFKYCV